MLFQYIVTIEEGRRAFLFRNRCLAGYLKPGRHRIWRITSDYEVKVFRTSAGVHPVTPDLDLEGVLPAEDGYVLEVPVDHAALVSQDGRPHAVLAPGKYVLWQVNATHEAELVDLTGLDSTIPVAYREKAGALVHEVWISAHERGLLHVDGKLERVLGPGRHALSPWYRKLHVERMDVRERELQVVGQELVTADKVSLRLNLIAKYRIVDPEKAALAVDSLHDALYAEAQVAARHVVAGVSVDVLLEQRAELSRVMTEAVRDRALQWGVEIGHLDIKDVVLPGEMKTLLNQVIEAEKRAAAQVILRREEVAATRSLANTARLLEQNPVLLRLKELETLKEIVERIPQLTVVLGGEELSKLRLGIPAGE